MRSFQVIVIACICLFCIGACSKKQEPAQEIETGKGTPTLPAQPYAYISPNSNKFNERATLGRVLFYDKALSFDNSMACGSCHKQQFGFADEVRFHKGVYGNTLKRNTLSITGNSTKLFWDGRSGSLSDLVLRPLSNHDEMLQDLSALPAKLSLLEYYKKLFEDAYGDPTISLAEIQDALATFCGVLTPLNSKFDMALRKANGNIKQGLPGFTAAENEGLALFVGKATCGRCHNSRVNTETYFPPSENIGLDLVYTDNGIGALTNDPNFNGLFKTPNLTNVALTAPYMHDGRFKTLEEVVDHYDHNIANHPNLSKLLTQIGETNSDEVPIPTQLHLTNEEKKSLVAFLKTFTDDSFVHDTRLSNPF